MRKNDPSIPMINIVTFSLVCLTGILSILPRNVDLRPLQLAGLGLSIVAVLGINLAAYRLYRRCKQLLGNGA